MQYGNLNVFLNFFFQVIPSSVNFPSRKQKLQYLSLLLPSEFVPPVFGSWLSGIPQLWQSFTSFSMIMYLLSYEKCLRLVSCRLSPTLPPEVGNLPFIAARRLATYLLYAFINSITRNSPTRPGLTTSRLASSSVASSCVCRGS